jgi:hypothetical protein
LLWNAKFVCDTNFKRRCENNASYRLFTDLGDISQLFFGKYFSQRKKRKYQTSIAIITFFFLQVD